MSAVAVLGIMGLAPPETTAASVPEGPAAPPGATAPTEPPSILSSLDGRPYTVTLVTGDRVSLSIGPDGRYGVEPVPRPDGSIQEVLIHGTDDGTYALPDDALPYIASGLVDEELFNVEYLAANGYADQDRSELPVIVEYADQHGTATLSRAAERLPASRQTVTLESINAAGVSVEKAGASDFWASVVGDQTEGDSGPQTTNAPGGVERVWLDRVAHVDLDESVPQIGAPEAWGAGFDGTGTTVAVLDTGVDFEHPDLGGKVVAAESFVTDGEPVDGHGHGTHVASTIAGTGAGSDGRYTGVAPGAELVIGKVCRDSGSCPSSAIIAGMEWATLEQGVDIVSMSLGGGPTDGTDPESQAVNELTEQTGALFVIAAGNAGPGDSTVSSPGAASAALTVGAVDKADQLADFSSRGPRVGDYAIKPEITAPGVGIVAARAAGTSMGEPVDDLYTAANGTSMATPHVAGAAAIVAQQHPDWDAEELKAALVSTAEDGGYTVYEQGAGRVDVARAVTQAVQVTPATIDFRLVPGTQDQPPAPQTLTYANPTGEAVTLDLSLSVRSVEGGDPLPDDAVSIDEDTLTVPAFGTAPVTVTLDHTGINAATYTGNIVATTGDGVRLTTPVGFAVLFPVTLTVTHSGNPPYFAASATLIEAVDGRPRQYRHWVESPPLEETATPECCSFSEELWLQAGTYSVLSFHVRWVDVVTGQEQSAWLIDPEVTVPGDTEVVLDAADAEKVTVETPQPSEHWATSSVVSYQRWDPERLDPDDYGRQAGMQYLAGSVAQLQGNFWVTPTEEVSRGEMVFSTLLPRIPPRLTMTVTDPEGFDLHPVYHQDDPRELMFEGSQTLPVVDAGHTCGFVRSSGSCPEEEWDRIDRLDVDGKLVLVSGDGYPITNGFYYCAWPAPEIQQRLVAGGAAGLILAQTDRVLVPIGDHEDVYSGRGCALDDEYYDNRYYPLSVPRVYLSLREAEVLRERFGRGEEVRIGVDGTPQDLPSGLVDPAYFYNLHLYHNGQIPESLNYTLTEDDFAVFEHRFHAREPGVVQGFQSGVWRPTDFTSEPASLGTRIRTPSELTEYVYVSLRDPDTVLWHRSFSTQRGEFRYGRFAPGSRTTVDWHDSPAVPAVTPSLAGTHPDIPLGYAAFVEALCAGCRQGGVFWPQLRYTGSSDPNQAGMRAGFTIFAYEGLPVVPIDDWAPDPDFRLSRDGEEIPQTPFAYEFNPVFSPGWMVPALGYELPPEAGRYRFSHRLEGVDTAWEFSSQDVASDEVPDPYTCTGEWLAAVGSPDFEEPTPPCSPEPLIFLRYDLGLDLTNRVRGTGSHAFEVTAYRQPSPAEMPEIAGLDLWVSYDGGDEWREARVRSLGDGRFEVRVVHPPAHRRASDTVSIRAEAWDVDGNRLEQTIASAFGLTARGVDSSAGSQVPR